MSARCRTGFSFRVAAGIIPEVISRIVECGRKHAVITDTASAFGWPAWAKAAKAAELHTVFGVELPVSPGIMAKKPISDRWTFLARDSVRPLNELIGTATAQFRYTPLLSVEQASAAQGVFRIIGHRTDLASVAPDAATFVAAAPSCAPAYLRQARSLGHKLIACDDNYYPREADEGFYQILVGRNASSQTYKRFILSDEEWLEEMQWSAELSEADCKAALATRDEVLDQCNASLVPGVTLQPDRSLTLRELCLIHSKNLPVDLKDPVYKARLDHELAMIESKGFVDYFIIVGDMVRYSREVMCVGPARGSSAGSLVCYLLGITTLDPIKHDLIFERFMDVTRDDAPDIDIDFNDSKRDLAFKHMATKYGQEHVARLGTIMMFKAASSVNDTAAALGIPKWEAIPVLESLTKRSSGDVRMAEQLGDALRQTAAGAAFLKKWPEMAIASRMESHPRNQGQHASGMVLTQKPIIEHCAVDSRTNAVHLDKRAAEDLGLLKIDCLGLVQLGIFEQCLLMAGLPHDHLDSVPLDDKAAFDVMNRHQYAGIFQFMGQAVKDVAINIPFSNIEDFVAATAIARPGPMGGGATRQWVQRRAGREPVVYPHPSFEPYTSKTYGVIIYQEQIMMIAKHVGEMTWPEVMALRSGMSRSRGKDYFDFYGERFKIGARKHGIPEDLLIRLWDGICSFGNMAFNRGHSVAYGIVSYWCCWLKAHYPMEFAAASLNHEKDPDKQIELLRELNDEGISYVPIDPEQSTDVWSVSYRDNKRSLIGPVGNVHGMGPKMVRTFMSAKKRNEEIPARIQKLLLGGQTNLDSLWPIRDRIKILMPDPRERNILSRPETVKEIMEREKERPVLLLGLLLTINKRWENELVNIAKRGGQKVTGPEYSLNLKVKDDTGVIFAKVGRFNFERLGAPIVERGAAGKALYAFKGRSWANDIFVGIQIDQVKFLGMLK